MIHPSAVIDKTAQIAEGTRIGPYSIIGPDVLIGENCQVGPHVVINGPCKIGRNNRIFQFASVGEEPQDKKYHGEPSVLEIGDDNTIRESVTINRGTADGGNLTKIGSRNWIMAYVHIAHDCLLGDDIIMANSATLAGHVTIENFAILGGFTKVHQFCRIGAHAFTGMGSAINRDVLPFITVSGQMAKPRSINSEGLKRRDFSAERIQLIKKAYKTIYLAGRSLENALEELTSWNDPSGDIEKLLAFIRNSERSILR